VVRGGSARVVVFVGRGGGVLGGSAGAGVGAKGKKISVSVFLPKKKGGERRIEHQRKGPLAAQPHRRKAYGRRDG